MDDYKIKILNQQFEHLKEKRILLYGTRKTALYMIENLREIQIVGLLDRVILEGEFHGIPIITWEEAEDVHADAIVIAAAIYNCKEIYHRIKYVCASLKLDIYDSCGKNLTAYYQFKDMPNIDIEYLKKSKEDLINKIDEYDAISFDMFDTLVMRKTLEPVDVFGIVEERLKQKGIVSHNFKKKRRSAELEAETGEIHCIYKTFQKITGYSEEECHLIMEEEILCEKECIIPREDIVEVMRCALKKGKEVNIVSDMHLSEKILLEILKKLGIDGFNKLYVSCEYGVGKGNGLFEIYKDRIGDKRCLHIGDNRESDILAAQKSGIDAYWIMSAYEILQISSFRRLLMYAKGTANRLAIGFVISRIFNSPFALKNFLGGIDVGDNKLFSAAFIAPTALTYMQQLLLLLKKEEYDMVLFSARDCYLFERIYKTWRKNRNETPSIYFLTSRKAGLLSTIFSVEDIEFFCSKFVQHEDALEDLWSTLLPNVQATEMQILEKCSKLRENYLYYMNRKGIQPNGNYLICELISRGTVHTALNQLLCNHVDGFYLCKIICDVENDNKVYSVYDDINEKYLIDKWDMLEAIFTAPYPSLQWIDENGMPVYAEEVRTNKEIENLLSMQEQIEKFVSEFSGFLGWDNIISPEFADELLGMIDMVKFKGESLEFIMTENIDDMSKRKDKRLKDN